MIQQCLYSVLLKLVNSSSRNDRVAYLEITSLNITIINSGGRMNNRKNALESYSNQEDTSGNSILTTKVNWMRSKV